MNLERTKIAIFASGGGSNARKILEHFQNNEDIVVELIVSNNPEAGVLNHAKEFSVASKVFPNEEFKSGEAVFEFLKESGIDYVVLAGFMRKIPNMLTDYYVDKIINIHPALLPKFGGKGMYGMNVHKAVKEANETVSGPTIHLVNEKYDDGVILAQFQTVLSKSDDVKDIQQKVLSLEHKYFAKVIESYILNKK